MPRRRITIKSRLKNSHVLSEFREFAVRGSVIDMAVGIIIGGAFGSIAKSLVNDIIMPPLGLILSDADFTGFYILLHAGNPPPPYSSLAAAQAAGAVTINYGLFLNAIISFLVVAWATFFLVRSINRLRRTKDEPAGPPKTKACTYCQTTIPYAATRCPNCTSQL
jgi:large conductance mechanosensitive channel